jgi:hypothetical protein
VGSKQRAVKRVKAFHRPLYRFQEKSFAAAATAGAEGK